MNGSDAVKKIEELDRQVKTILARVEELEKMSGKINLPDPSVLKNWKLRV